MNRIVARLYGEERLPPTSDFIVKSLSVQAVSERQDRLIKPAAVTVTVKSEPFRESLMRVLLEEVNSVICLLKIIATPVVELER